ncbi:MAG: GntR family transcriptional regulator [Actinobacteria bacterium]|nr:GntR family transcriptional regulator [Actinomycetota bacterium]
MIKFETDPQSDLPLWIQLRNRLVHLISTGYYHPGDQLPTVRGLASDLSINYNTVNKTYLSMIDDGYITSTRGRGVFVRERDGESDEASLEAEALLDDFIESCRTIGLTSWEIRKLLSARVRSMQPEDSRLLNSDDVSAEKDREVDANGQNKPGQYSA